MKAAVALLDLSFQYPKGDFTLSCPRLEFNFGELSLITGPNGSGKTTLSKLMCGILKPQRGSLYLSGEKANAWPLGKIGKRVGYLYQDPAWQLFAPTVWEEMTFVDNLLGRDPRAAEKKAAGLLEQFGLSSLKKRSVYRLSGGEKQRLALATILMAGAEFLILDEPTVGLDQENREKLYSLIDGLLKMGKGLAVITHEKELLGRLRARRIRLEGGRVGV